MVKYKCKTFQKQQAQGFLYLLYHLGIASKEEYEYKRLIVIPVKSTL